MLSFTIPETGFPPFPTFRGFQVRILSRVPPGSDVAHHRVDRVDPAPPGGRRPITVSFRPTQISFRTRTRTRRNSNHAPQRLQNSFAFLATNDRVDSTEELSASTLPTDLALEPTQYHPTEPVSTPPATTTDASHVASGTIGPDTFLHP